MIGVGLPKRWLLLGPGGADKTTLGVELGAIMRIPIIHLDRHYWQPGWVEPSHDEWDAKVLELAASDMWIMDGNYSRTLHCALPTTIHGGDGPRASRKAPSPVRR